MDKERKAWIYTLAGIVAAVLLVVGLALGLNKEGLYRQRLVGTWYHEGYSFPTVTLYDDGTCTFYRAFYDENGAVTSWEKSGDGRWIVFTENDEIKLKVFRDNDSEVVIVAAARNDRIILRPEDEIYGVTFWNKPHI